MALSRDEFVDRWVASGLVTADEARASVSALPESIASGEDTARELVRLKKLTVFQAQQILAGRGKSLILGNYILTDKLGQGGMGMVLKAEHRRMKRVVALKVLSPAVVRTKELLQRFQREVEAAARLTHPNIVAAFDADEANGVHYLVMEYVPGKDLASLVKERGPLTVRQAVDLLKQAATGLEFAHSQGIIHRDIKPANLLLSSNGTLKILDMGLARLAPSGNETGGQADLTNTGAVMGTVDYMSPEQALNTKLADERADVYSLGCTLYYLLTGRSVYAGDTLMEKILAHREAPIPELPLNEAQSTELSSEGRSGLNAVLSRMLAKAPEDRLRSMTEVLAALKAISSGSAVAFTPLTGQSLATRSLQPDSNVGGGTIGGPAPSLNLPTAVEPSIATRMKTRQKQPLPRSVWLGGGAAVLASLAVLLIVPRLSGKKPTVAPTTKSVTAEVSASQVPDSKASPAEDPLWPSGEADTVWKGIVSHPTKLPGIRRWQVESTMPRARATGAAWSPDGRWLAVASEDARIRLYNRVESSLRMRHVLPAFDRSQECALFWTPDSRWLGWQGNSSNEFRSFDLVEMRSGPTVSSAHLRVAGGWNPEGNLLAVPGIDAGGAGVLLWNWPSGTLARPLRGTQDVPWQVAWSPDGSRVAATDFVSMQVWQASGELLGKATFGGSQILSLAWHPNEDLIAARLHKPNRLALFNSRAEQIALADLAPSDNSSLRPIAWSPDGRWLSMDVIPHGELQLFNKDGHAGPLLPGTGGSGPTLWRPGSRECFTPGDNYPSSLASYDQLDSASHPFQAGTRIAAWSPDGNWLAAVSVAGELMLWDAVARQTTQVETSGQNNVINARWSHSRDRWLVHAIPNVHVGTKSRILTVADSGGILESVEFPSNESTSVVGLTSDGDRALVLRHQATTRLESYSLASLSNVSEVPLPRIDGSQFSGIPAMAANGRMLVKVRRGETEECWLTDTKGQQAKLLNFGATSMLHWSSFSGDGARLAVCVSTPDHSEWQVQIWEPTKPSKVKTLPKDIPGAVSLSPDARYLAAASIHGGLYDLQTGQALQRFDLGHGHRVSSNWHPTRPTVATTDVNDNVLQINATSGLEPSLSILDPFGVSWTDDGSQLLAMSAAGMLRSFREGSTSSNWTTVLLPDEQWATFSPGGRLVKGSEDAKTHLRAIVERDDGTFETLDYADFLAKHGPKSVLPPLDYKAERDVAHKLLDAGCTVHLIQNGKDIDLHDFGDIPTGDFHVHAIGLSTSPRCDDRVLADVARCRRLDFLSIVGVNISDEGLAHLGKLPALRQLAIGDLPLVTSRGWKLLGNIKPLLRLDISGNVPDDVFAVAPQLPNLQTVYAIGPRPPVDLTPLFSCLQLEAVFVSGIDVDNTPAEKWLKLSRLGILHLQPATKKSVELIDRLPSHVQGDIYGFVDDEAVVAATQLTTGRLLTISGFRGAPNSPWLELRRRWPSDQKVVIHGHHLPAELPASPPRRGLEFDGIAGHVRVPSLTLEGENAWTIEGYVVPDPITCSSDQVLAFVEPVEASLYAEHGGGVSDLRRWHFHAGSGEVSRVSTELTEVLLRRQHLAAVWDGERATLYVDGVPVTARDTVTLPPSDFQTGLTLGGQRKPEGIFQNGWSGVIESLRVSKSARYLEAFTPPETFDLDENTMALYRCDEGSGKKLNDASTNGHHGTIYGARWVNEP